mmetsp:Transcript_2840/g.7565  ORF Transcript_2840/g.7565 Transcript_2840/m.7565 type:complete len:339 (+) Transcript_2840:212-1228(+)
MHARLLLLRCLEVLGRSHVHILVRGHLHILRGGRARSLYKKLQRGQGVSHTTRLLLRQLGSLGRLLAARLLRFHGLAGLLLRGHRGLGRRLRFVGGFLGCCQLVPGDVGQRPRPEELGVGLRRGGPLLLHLLADEAGLLLEGLSDVLQDDLVELLALFRLYPKGSAGSYHKHLLDASPLEARDHGLNRCVLLGLVVLPAALFERLQVAVEHECDLLVLLLAVGEGLLDAGGAALRLLMLALFPLHLVPRLLQELLLLSRHPGGRLGGGGGLFEGCLFRLDSGVLFPDAPAVFGLLLQSSALRAPQGIANQVEELPLTLMPSGTTDESVRQTICHHLAR